MDIYFLAKQLVPGVSCGSGEAGRGFILMIRFLLSHMHLFIFLETEYSQPLTRARSDSYPTRETHDISRTRQIKLRSAGEPQLPAYIDRPTNVMRYVVDGEAKHQSVSLSGEHV